MRVSVVINTYNRCRSLQKALRSLYFQTFQDFEVIVVNGPSTDETARVLAECNGQIKVRQCPISNLSVSRNIGIDAASGDIVAFIDDDSIATQTWLQELIVAFNLDEVGGAGGIVYDHTGMKLQAKYVACFRMGGRPVTDLRPPFDKYTVPGADPFLHLLGTNASYRRSMLAIVGGFDEEYDYFLDETDLCMRIIDSGYKLVAIEKAVVHHKFLESHLRTSRRVLFDPYSVAKNIVYFSLQSRKDSTVPNFEVQLEEYLETKKCEGEWCYLNGLMTKQQYDYFRKRFAQGIRDGWERGKSPRKTRRISDQPPEGFLPFPTVERRSERLTLCFACREYPPHSYGGNGRHTYDLAVTFARKGHEVHVITSSHHDNSYMDMEDDVWVHRLVEEPAPGFQDHPLGPTLSLISRNFCEAKRIHAESPISIFIAPIWMVEGTLAACAELFPTVISLMTTHKVMQEINPHFGGVDYLRYMVPFEQLALMRHDYAHAISDSIKKRVASDYELPEHTFVAPLCVRDLSSMVQRCSANNRVRVLFVGRIERRKGVDVLLRAAELSLPENDLLEFVLVGKDAHENDYDVVREFHLRNTGKDNILSRVIFTGEVTEMELQQHYADSDIFCLPSRYESFGLVLLEAMSFSKPTVACRTGGMVEVVEDGISGYLFDPENTEQLARQILALADNDGLRESMGAAGRERFLKRFSPEAVTNLLEKRYREVIADFAGKSHHPELELAESRLAQILSSSILMDYQQALSAVKKLIRLEVPLQNQAMAISKWVRSLKACKNALQKRFPGLVGKAVTYARHFARLAPRLKAWTFNTVLRLIPSTKSNFRATQDLLEHLQKQHEHLQKQHEHLQKQHEHWNGIMNETTKSITSLQATVAETKDEVLAFAARSRNEIMFELFHLKPRNAQGSENDRLEWRVLNSSKLNQAVEKGNLRINLGCGHIPLEGYINIDQRELAGVDIVGNVLQLQLATASVFELYAAHLLEHFPREMLRRKLLPHWFSLIKNGGIIRLVIPDAEAMLEAYAAGTISFDELREVTFGLQEYGGDFHFDMFNRKDISSILTEAGFASVSFAVVGRRNGICYEMEVLASKDNL